MKRRGDSYGGMSRLERSTQRRERLVEAALELFSARNWIEVTVSDVCVHAQVSKRYFYEHFTDRSDLLLQVRTEQNRWLINGMEAASPQDPSSPREFFLPMMKAVATMLSDHPRRARIIYVDAPRLEPLCQESVRGQTEFFDRLICRFVAPRHDRVLFRRASLALVFGLSQVMTDWVARGMTDPVDPLAEHLTRIICAVLHDLG